MGLLQKKPFICFNVALCGMDCSQDLFLNKKKIIFNICEKSRVNSKFY